MMNFADAILAGSNLRLEDGSYKMRALRGYGPPSEKPASMRDEFDLAKLSKAEAKRQRKAAKRTRDNISRMMGKPSEDDLCE